MSEPVEQLLPRDWAVLRDIRLRALADSPDAFGVLLEEAQAQPDEVWRERRERPSPTYAVRAGPDGPAVAMGGLWLREDRPAEAMVWGMWTAPEARGHGHAGRLLDTLVRAAAAAGRHRIELHVTEGNDMARRLYLARGFDVTGQWEPLRKGSPLRIELLRHTLPPAG